METAGVGGRLLGMFYQTGSLLFASASPPLRTQPSSRHFLPQFILFFPNLHPLRSGDISIPQRLYNTLIPARY